MEIANSDVMSLKKFAEENGFEDHDLLRRAAKKYGALHEVAGLQFIDRTLFEAGVIAELDRKIQVVARRAARTKTGGGSYGLLVAHVNRAPGMILKKEAAVSEARKNLEEAHSLRKRERAQNILEGLEAGLERMKANYEKNKIELERQMNEVSEE